MAVDLSLIAEVNPSFDPTTTNVTIQLKQYPYPPFNKDEMTGPIKVAIPLFIMIGFVVVAATICQEIVLEKENKFKVVQSFACIVTYCYICVTSRSYI